MKTSLRSGKLKKWKDDRGFGFIQPVDGSQEIYLHISEIKNSTRRPKENDTIYYYTIVDSDGKTRACNAFILGARIKLGSSSSPSYESIISDRSSNTTIPIAEMLLLLITPGFGSVHFIWITKNPIPLILYTVMSLLTYALYSDDKIRAKRNLWRTPEQTLHLSELAGGWIGGFLAQRILRHKSSKPTYQSVFWSIVAIHHIAWICWFWFWFGRSLLK
jgi:uncharacterized membrane protein YsdA (DUF1294 family)/cold shock CspA family protein